MKIELIIFCPIYVLAIHNWQPYANYSSGKISWEEILECV